MIIYYLQKAGHPDFTEKQKKTGENKKIHLLKMVLNTKLLMDLKKNLHKA